jgi:hypothetical protein
MNPNSAVGNQFTAKAQRAQRTFNEERNGLLGEGLIYASNIPSLLLFLCVLAP